ncbi:helix-turn-helix protein [compost metagenome]
MTTKKTAVRETVSSEAVRQVRVAAGLTQVKAAALIGFSTSQLARWESGKDSEMGKALFDLYVKEIQDFVDSNNPNFNTRPKPGSVWVHRKGGYEYTVVLVTSQPNKAQASQHPVQVVYKSATTGETWARGLVAFHQAFVEKPFKAITGGKAVSERDKFKPAAKKPVAKKPTPKASDASWPFPTAGGFGTAVPARKPAPAIRNRKA